MRKYGHYLVFLKSCTWNGSSGYKIFGDLNSALNSRGYDFGAILKKKTQKYILRMESSHDVPMGYPSAVIGLTDNEYYQLKDASFKKVETFAKKYLNL